MPLKNLKWYSLFNKTLSLQDFKVDLPKNVFGLFLKRLSHFPFSYRILKYWRIIFPFNSNNPKFDIKKSTFKNFLCRGRSLKKLIDSFLLKVQVCFYKFQYYKGRSGPEWYTPIKNMLYGEYVPCWTPGTNWVSYKRSIYVLCLEIW